MPHTLRAQHELLGRITRRLLPLLGASYVLAHLDRVNVSFAALTMNADLGFSETVYGLGAGLFFVGYLLFEVPSNLLLERIGARRLLAAIMVIWGGVSMGMAGVQSAPQFYAIRFVLGLAEAGLFPGILLYLTYWFPQRERAGAVGLFALALVVAGVLGSPLSGAILDGAHGWLGLRGWQWLFILEGLPTVVLATFVWRVLPDGPMQAPWLSGAERAWLRTVVETAGEPPADTVRPVSWLARLGNRGVWVPALAYFLFLGAFSGTLFWAPKLAHAVLPGLSSAGIGWLVGVPYLAFATGMLLWGRHSDRTGERHWHVTLGLGMATAGYGVMALAHSLPVLVAGLILALLGAGAGFGCFWSLVMGALTRMDHAVGIAVVNSAGALGSFLAVAAVGRLRDLTEDYQAGFWVLAAASAGSALVVLAVPGRAAFTFGAVRSAPDSARCG